ncbi:hypothetical protein B0H16DRAFT_465117 [Mycena metata]|uniref:Uncharacterized protein n=1 Tax=Mycena metata TaxID=1033252 RepID=A0AAD7KC11_9AGAR|nr:hypothetical protein B0H16DRAFT_465117 [Mycena metata]
MSTTVSSAPQNEEQLRALNRRELQTLAKSEDIKPANAASNVLVQRLLAKLFPVEQPASSPPAPPKATSPQPKPEVTTPSLSLREQRRRSTRVATEHDTVAAASRSVIFTPAAPAANGEDTPIHPNSAPSPGPRAVPPPPPVAGPSKPRRKPAVQEILRAGNELLYVGRATHPSHPAQPFLCPTRRYLRSFKAKLSNLEATFFDIPSSLSTMERVLQGVERAAADATKGLKTCAWNGYYLERNILQNLKVDQSLYDGTCTMEPGPARDRWLGFLQEVEREYERQEQDEAASDSGNNLKRRRDEETGDPSKSSKRRRAPSEEL